MIGRSSVGPGFKRTSASKLRVDFCEGDEVGKGVTQDEFAVAGSRPWYTKELQCVLALALEQGDSIGVDLE
jgi:hypothetical protein